MNTLVFAVHYLSFAVAVGCLSVQVFFLRQSLHLGQIRVGLLARVDAVYGLAAVASLVTGLMRVFWYGKGVSYYSTHSVFWVKVGLFAVIGVLSIYPTVQLLKNRPLALRDWALNRPKIVGRVRRLVIFELVLFVILPFAAALLAHGPHF